uniref:Interleukin-12 subunit beta n=1 Tax=Malurus cyaneus samueli TaxID=2593467 RepID=A0A8C5U469_9PASS
LEINYKINREKYIQPLLKRTKNWILVLTCNSSEEAVYWSKDSQWRQQGKSLMAVVKEFPDAGNYSCLSQQSHEVLSSNLLLISKIDSKGQMVRWILKSFNEPKWSFLKCEAKNYSGIFTCSWMTENKSPNMKFTLRSLKGPQGDVSCSSPMAHPEGVLTTYTAQCHQQSFCAFAEEQQPLDMVLEVIDEVEYENYSASFFIRDIVKPDPPQCQYEATTGTVTWTYPKTWSTPNSYFPLTFKVRVKSTKRPRYQVKIHFSGIGSLWDTTSVGLGHLEHQSQWVWVTLGCHPQWF